MLFLHGDLEDRILFRYGSHAIFAWRCGRSRAISMRTACYSLHGDLPDRMHFLHSDLADRMLLHAISERPALAQYEVRSKSVALDLK